MDDHAPESAVAPATENTADGHLEQPDMADVELVEVMRALSDPIRLTLLSVMSDGEFHSCSPESWGVDLHKSTLSHHFKVLRDAGVTTTRVSGRNRDTRLRKAELDDRFPGFIDSLVSGLALSQNA